MCTTEGRMVSLGGARACPDECKIRNVPDITTNNNSKQLHAVFICRRRRSRLLSDLEPAMQSLKVQSFLISSKNSRCIHFGMDYTFAAYVFSHRHRWWRALHISLLLLHPTSFTLCTCVRASVSASAEQTDAMNRNNNNIVPKN